MEKNSSIFPFSYILSVLLIFPILNYGFFYYQLSTIASIFIYIIVVSLINNILTFLNIKYNIFKIIFSNKIVQQYVFNFLKLEIFVRKNIFFFLCIYSNIYLLILQSFYTKRKFAF
jgi:hypothetical protein